MDASTIMTRIVVTVTPETPLSEVVRLMVERGISAVPVVDHDSLVGIISEDDLMRPFGEKNALRCSWWFNLLAEGTDLPSEFANYLRLDQHRASDLMKDRVVTATENTTMAQIPDLLWENHIKRVPIVRDGAVVGVVIRADIVRTLATKPEIVSEPV